jgi:hypothetical protein
MSNAKENDHLDEPDQKFLSRISVGEEETDEMDTVENGGQQNGHGRHGMIGKVVNGNNAKGEDTESIRSGSEHWNLGMGGNHKTVLFHSFS